MPPVALGRAAGVRWGAVGAEGRGSGALGGSGPKGQAGLGPFTNAHHFRGDHDVCLLRRQIEHKVTPPPEQLTSSIFLPTSSLSSMSSSCSSPLSSSPCPAATEKDGCVSFLPGFPISRHGPPSDTCPPSRWPSLTLVSRAAALDTVLSSFLAICCSMLPEERKGKFNTDTRRA